MTSIVIAGVDASDTAAEAARRAVRLAEALGAELHLVCAYGKYESTTFESGPESFRCSTEGEALRIARTVAEQVQVEAPALRIHAAPGEGKPAAALVEAAERLGADVIVVGNKRVQGLSRILGSIARDVAQQAPCDVYIAHTHDR